MATPSINLRQLRLACVKMHAGLGREANFPLITRMAYRVEGLITGEEPFDFKEALRYVLNEFYLRDEERKLYRAVLGCYFGSHGGRKAAKNRGSGKPRKAKPKAPGPEYDKKTRQWTFRF